MPRDDPARSVGKWMPCSVYLALLLFQVLQGAETLRAGYRLPQTAGRSASGTDVGSGRDLFKKFMLFRGLFPQEPARENIIVIPQSIPTFTTPTTTTTTTTTIINGNDTRRWRHLDHSLPTQLDDGDSAQQRVTRRRKPSSNKQGRHKKKRRHRHIHKPRQQQRQRLRQRHRRHRR
ncbi:PREDICTED: uncharacterized protein LOC108618063 [Drosophila arizonae]|uniref:Uncharacterized protein LOC108618063 n=1 Tax=Drosophila arizonae TaxID=7263 RepID=A0ABM1PQH2_DROAR|nr:PREDICTED: uncharacterized protein LOC108618063 [Drosophila arizonae]